MKLMSTQCSWLVGMIAKHKLGRFSLFSTSKATGLTFAYGSPSGNATAGLGVSLRLLHTLSSLSLWSVANCVVRSFGNPKLLLARLVLLLGQRPNLPCRIPDVKLFGAFGYNSVRFESKAGDIVSPHDAARIPVTHLLLTKEHLSSTNSTSWYSVFLSQTPNAFSRANRKVKWMTKAAYSINTELVSAVVGAQPIDDVFMPRGSAFTRLAHQTIDDIAIGNIMQLQISRRFLFACGSSSARRMLEEMYRINPSPYTFCFNFGYYKIVGTSPETLVVVSCLGSRLSGIKPIAGTRPRGKTTEQDTKLKDELKGNPKEVAEHVMLVDLARNDLSKAGGLVQVVVGNTLVVEQYSHVQHIVSTVRSKPREPLDCLEAVWCSFPAGTVAGAPKRKAMTLIGERERINRSFYGGAVGFVSHEGTSLAITIRSVLVVGQSLHAQSAAGIVRDSNLANELRETDNKTMVVLSALRGTRGGSVSI